MLLLALVSCTYGSARLDVVIENALGKPDSHTLAVAVNYRRVQDPTGLSAFPDGGSLVELEHRARVYLIDVDTQSIKLVADIGEVKEIPRPTGVWIQGWRNGAIYFSIRGYGVKSRSGDNVANIRRVNYRVYEGQAPEQMGDFPVDLVSANNSGPLGKPPFLRLSKGHNEIDIGIDERPDRSNVTYRLTIDELSGEPRLHAFSRVKL